MHGTYLSCPKKEPDKFGFPKVGVANDIVAALGVTVDAVSKGEITPDEASGLPGLLEIKRKAIEIVGIERRI
jgi:hypothetical protein